MSHTVAKDAYGYNLYYNNTDYTPIVTTKQPFATTLQTNGSLRQLFNGNIAASSVNIPQLTAGAYWIDRLYTYDQLNRIKSTTAYHTVSTSSTPVHNGDYDEQFIYDGNGNILSVNRAGSGTGTLQDNLSYNYNRNAYNRLLNNQLNYLNGHAAASNITPDQAANNYTYDPIGNLTADVQAGITGINWSVYGKIQAINKASGNITYTYNPAGERVSKTAAGLTTYYIRDAQGNTLAVYDNAHSTINWKEQQLYGSSRLGMWTPNANLGSNNALAIWDTIGRKQYELNNYLGNNLATITDKRIQHTTNTTSIDYFNADISTAQDYYSFGSLLPGMQYNYLASSYYRYGFNGQEKSDEIAGSGNHNTAEFGEYDTRLGRRWNLDPLPNAGVSSYSVFGNNPILKSDVALDTPSVHEAAQMSADSYNTYANRDKIDGGWTRVKEARGVQFYDKESNFRSALYSRTIGGKTEYTYATAGTVNLTDWGNNLDQPLGVSSAYDFSRQQAQRLVKNLPGMEITFTGHSLGGGEASLNALSTNKYAITFNAAGLGAATKLRYNLMFHKENILAFIVPGEAVSTYQSNVFLSAAGKHVYVDARWGEVSPFKASLISLLPLAPPARIKLHLMPAVFDALETSGYGSPYPTPNDPNQIHSWGDFMRSINRLVHWGD